MKTFKQFVAERKRTPDEAIKLGNYMLARHKRTATNKDRNVLTPFPAWHKDRQAEHDDHDLEHFAKAWSNAKSRFRKKNIEDLPIKDVVKHNWQPVDWDEKYVRNHKSKDERPINVARSRKTGELSIVDGFHRLHWQRLLGNKDIKANVQDVGYGKRKKK